MTGRAGRIASPGRVTTPLQRSPTPRGPAPIRSKNARLDRMIVREGAILERLCDGVAPHLVVLDPANAIKPIIRRRRRLGGTGKPDVSGAPPSAPLFDIGAP